MSGAFNRLAAFFLGLFALVFVAGAAHAQATATVDWANLGRASLTAVPSGSSVAATDGTNVTVSYTTQTNGGTFVPVFDNSYLVYFDGTFGGATRPLLLNFDNNAYDPADKVTTTITLGRAVTGLRFRVTDIDAGGFRDAISVSYDTGSGTFVNAANTTTFWTAGTATQRTNDGIVNGWTGIAGAAQTETTGDVVFNFGTTAVKRIRITYFSYTGSGDPGAQYAGISGLSFDTPGADLSLTKTAVTASPTAGSTATFRLTVTSATTSTATATGIQVRDVLPAGFDYSGFSGTGSYDSGTGIWTVGTLAPGASATINLNGTINASSGATLTNVAEIVASSQPDRDSTPGNGVTTEDDYATATMTVGGARVAGTPPTLVCPAGTTLFDWTPRTWASGSTDNSYQLDAIGPIRFQMNNPGVWLNNAAVGGQSPSKQDIVHGGTFDSSILQLVDLNNTAEVVTTTITLPAIMRGAQFTLFDVDSAAGQFADRIEVIGRYQGASVSPRLTNGIANYVVANQAFGDGASDSDRPDGNVVVTFSSAIDTIIIRYGNHSAAPANPGQQGVALHDITFCQPTTDIVSTKSSTVLRDPISGEDNPKAIPGATVRYCLAFRNGGENIASNVVASDILQSDLTYVPGSLRSGASCANASQVEDDDASGADESDPFGASFTAGSVSANASTLASGAGFAVTFEATVD